MTTPIHRRLQVFTLDPAADVCLDTAPISRSVIKVPWEPLEPGPVGEYLEVIDVDPASNSVYAPVDLNDAALLAQDGLTPSTGNPQFHQQMVYAVAMRTITNFEQVLGRKILWAERFTTGRGRNSYIRDPKNRYVRRLRIYPHALRVDNAFYSPAKRALLMGYFNAPTTDPRDELPGGMVFTCLSQDIIAHEMTHAILDGMHRRLLEPSNPDMLAFHEGYADIIAIFQHFTLPGFLPDQIQRTRGNLEQNNLLANLAQQFARSTGRGEALRNALGTFDSIGKRNPPDPTELGRTFEPHARGAILVAAVFDAFLRIYQGRVADLRRIATGGTGRLPDGDIHPDLARRFAAEAAESARRVLNMCIRALDYLPPVDVTFGDFLRALITADRDFLLDDPDRYRLAFIESFRERGIYPLDVRTLAEDSLCWSALPKRVHALAGELFPPVNVLRTMASALDGPGDWLSKLEKAFSRSVSTDSPQLKMFDKFDPDKMAEDFMSDAWRPTVSRGNGHPPRFQRYLLERSFKIFLHVWLKGMAKSMQGDSSKVEMLRWAFGIDVPGLLGKQHRSPLEVHAIRPTIRLRPDGTSRVELLIILTQKRWIELPPADGDAPGTDTQNGFWFRSGTTLIIDPQTGRVRYSISKSAHVDGEQNLRLERQRKFTLDQLAELGDAAVTRFGLTQAASDQLRKAEPFAMVHAERDSGEGY